MGIFRKKTEIKYYTWDDLKELTIFGENFAECQAELEIRDIELFKKHKWEFFNGGYASYNYSYYFRKLK